jgi:hypothetical protein
MQRQLRAAMRGNFFGKVMKQVTKCQHFFASEIVMVEVSYCLLSLFLRCTTNIWWNHYKDFFTYTIFFSSSKKINSHTQNKNPSFATDARKPWMPLIYRPRAISTFRHTPSIPLSEISQSLTNSFFKSVDIYNPKPIL